MTNPQVEEALHKHKWKVFITDKLRSARQALTVTRDRQDVKVRTQPSCPSCGGAGYLVEYLPNPGGSTKPCDTCHGTGEADRG